MQKFVLLATLFAVVHGKYFSRCNLIYELKRQGFPDEKLWDWVCLIENESGGATYAKGINKNGSHDYGLFQINDQFWCSNTTVPGKDCSVTCDQLMTDDITVACQCAMKIYNRHGFMAWYGWRDNCKDKPSMDANIMILQCYG